MSLTDQLRATWNLRPKYFVKSNGPCYHRDGSDFYRKKKTYRRQIRFGETSTWTDPVRQDGQNGQNGRNVRNGEQKLHLSTIDRISWKSRWLNYKAEKKQGEVEEERK